MFILLLNSAVKGVILSMEVTIQLLISGLAIGTVYSLIALGFSMMIRSVNLINFAQGDLAMIGGFLGFTFYGIIGLPFFISFLLAIVLTGGVGLLMERFALRRILRSRSPVINLTIAVLGLAFVFRTGAILIWGADPRAYPSIVGDDPLIFLGARIHPLNLLLMGLGLLAMITLHLFFQKTLTGISWRAGSLNPEVARLMGVSVNRTMVLTFALSGMVGGAAGVLVAALYFAVFNMGLPIAIKAFAAAALGGFGIVGTMLGGLAIGIIETFSVVYINPGYRDAISFGILILLLLLIYKPAVPAGRDIREKLRAVRGSSSYFLSNPNFKKQRIVLLILATIFWFLLPQRTDLYSLHLLNMGLIYSIGALGLQLINGYTGQISLGHAAFFGIGAYTSAILTMNFGFPFLLAILGSIIVAGLVAALLTPILRLSGFFLAMGTLALGQIIYLFMINWVNITRGPYGIYGIPTPEIGPFNFFEFDSYFYLLTVTIIIQLLIFSRLTSFKMGRSLLATRENERAAAACGIDTFKYKAIAFIVGCGSAGLAGAFYAHYQSYISPDSFTVLISINYLIMVVIGGLGSIPGAIIGAYAVVLLPEFLRFIADYRMIVFGGLLVVFMMFLPGGLAQIGREFLRFLERYVVKNKAFKGDRR